MVTDRLTLYRPTLVTILVFSGEPEGIGGSRRLVAPSIIELTRRLREIPGFPADLTVFREKGLLIFTTSKVPFKPPDPEKDPMCRVGMDELVNAARDCEKEAGQLSRVISRRVKGLRPLRRFLMIATGSENAYWFQTRIDMSQMITSSGHDEKTLKDLSARSKIDHLAGRLVGGRGMVGDVLTGIRGDPRLMGFRPGGGGIRSALPDIYLLDIPHETTGEMQVSSSTDENMYESVVDGVSGGFGRMLAYQCLLRDNERNVYPAEKESAEDIRDAIRNLQTSINALLKGELDDGDIPRLQATSAQPHGSTQEEKLLNLASMYFSQVTEFDAALESNTVDTYEYMGNTDHQAEMLGMSKISPADLDGETVLSLKEEMSRFANGVYHSYQNLKGTVNNSQNSLRNTVEVLKTSLENKQRVVNESREWMWNFLIVIIACFGLMDAITNFMIYYLNTNDAVTAVQYFFYSMLPILVVLLVIVTYMRYMQKRER